MVTTNKDIKIRNAKGKVESEVCLEAIFYFLGSGKEEDCFYEVPHVEIGRCGVYVYETKTLIVANYKGKARTNE